MLTEGRRFLKDHSLNESQAGRDMSIRLANRFTADPLAEVFVDLYCVQNVSVELV